MFKWGKKDTGIYFLVNGEFVFYNFVPRSLHQSILNVLKAKAKWGYSLKGEDKNLIESELNKAVVFHLETKFVEEDLEDAVIEIFVSEEKIEGPIKFFDGKGVIRLINCILVDAYKARAQYVRIKADCCKTDKNIPIEKFQ